MRRSSSNGNATSPPRATAHGTEAPSEPGLIDPPAGAAGIITFPPPVKVTFIIACALAVLGLCASASGRAPAVAPLVTLKVSPLAFSPNGNGFKDTSGLRSAWTRPSPLDRDHQQPRRRRLHEPAWRERERRHRLVPLERKDRNGPDSPVAPDGKYTLQVPRTIRLPGRARWYLRNSSSTPSRRSCAGGRVVSRRGFSRAATAFGSACTTLTTARVTVKLVDQDGRKLKNRPRTPWKPGKTDITWPSSHRARLAPSTYELSLSAVDEAGNVGVSTAKRFLVTRPVRAQVWAEFNGVGRRIALTFDDCYVGSACRASSGRCGGTASGRRSSAPARRCSPTPRSRADGARQARDRQSWLGSRRFLTALLRISSESASSPTRTIWWKLARVTPTPCFRPPYGSYTAAAVRPPAGRLLSRRPLGRRSAWANPGSGAIEGRILRPCVRGASCSCTPSADSPSSLADAGAACGHCLLLTLPELARIGMPNSGGWPAYSWLDQGS